jgi:hypothetical protein
MKTRTGTQNAHTCALPADSIMFAMQVSKWLNAAGLLTI